MKFNIYYLFYTLLMIGGAYAVLNHATVGSICRDSGRTIRSIAEPGSDMDEPSWEITLKIQQSLDKMGRNIEDTCSQRS